MAVQPGQQIFPMQNGLMPFDSGSPLIGSMRITQGSVVLNGATPVTAAAPNVTSSSSINITLKTVGGSVGAQPAIQTITPGTGFTVAGTAGDTSTYNYAIFG